MTKVFTGTLLADQVKRGTMRLDDPAQRYLPADVKLPRRDDRDITLLHLATHTSSLPVEPPYIGLLALSSKDPANPYGEYGQKQLIKTLKHLELGHPIGSRYAYSNLGVGLLGQALARTAKASSYQDLMVKQIAMPLGLPDTRLTLDAGQTKRLAPGHTALGARTSPWTFACLEACGGMRSTVRDMLIFTKANLGEIKTPLASAFQMAQEPWRETGHKGGFVGLCWQRWKLPPGESVVLWHNGGTGGYRSFMGLIPKKGAGVVVLSNSAHFVDAMGMEILKHLDKD
jgi:CubicO group peptidase (beta-lactamase class C family)